MSGAQTNGYVDRPTVWLIEGLFQRQFMPKKTGSGKLKKLSFSNYLYCQLCKHWQYVFSQKYRLCESCFKYLQANIRLAITINMRESHKKYDVVSCFFCVLGAIFRVVCNCIAIAQYACYLFQKNRSLTLLDGGVPMVHCVTCKSQKKKQ